MKMPHDLSRPMNELLEQKSHVMYVIMALLSSSRMIMLLYIRCHRYTFEATFSQIDEKQYNKETCFVIITNFVSLVS